MIKKAIILIFTAVYILANELVITKYFNEKPKIDIYFSGDKNVLKILKMDLTVLDHFNYKINQDNTAPYRFEFNYSNKKLTVKYFEKNILKSKKIYKSNSFAFFPFLVH